MNDTLLGGLSPADFLRRHWQKRPLLVRGALPGFRGLLDFETLAGLAAREDCESRLIVREGGLWRMEPGPHSRRRLRSLPPRGWTLLVQGVDGFLPAARELLGRFSFVPLARLDDLMVSFAPPGGGVGPHFDSYDVFLVQGPGRRRWRVSRQHDLSLVENAPLRILKRFRPQGQCILHPGDMLYLPPGWAHDGVAVDACYTYSIGFRAPSHRELVADFLVHLEDRLQPDAMYRDPDLQPPRHPAEIDAKMIGRVARVLERIRWSRKDVIDFLGCRLSEPKPHVTMHRPGAISYAGFLRRARRDGAELGAASRLLFYRRRGYINGTSFLMDASTAQPVRMLADTRRLVGACIPDHGPLPALLYRWYLDGYIRLGWETGSGEAP
ncbi:MAG TPA: cupin domain-containing protein [Burkholderiales bacterium]|nr:cupin domain-containing protein [Burkholderiales bacterium]